MALAMASAMPWQCDGALGMFPGTSGPGYDVTKPIPGHPCHNKYHLIRQGGETEATPRGLYSQLHRLAMDLDAFGSMPEDVTPSDEQCRILREIEGSQRAILKTVQDEQTCDVGSGEEVLPELVSCN